MEKKRRVAILFCTYAMFGGLGGCIFECTEPVTPSQPREVVLEEQGDDERNESKSKSSSSGP